MGEPDKNKKAQQAAPLRPTLWLPHYWGLGGLSPVQLRLLLLRDCRVSNNNTTLTQGFNCRRRPVIFRHIGEGPAVGRGARDGDLRRRPLRLGLCGLSRNRREAHKEQRQAKKCDFHEFLSVKCSQGKCLGDSRRLPALPGGAGMKCIDKKVAGGPCFRRRKLQPSFCLFKELWWTIPEALQIFTLILYSTAFYVNVIALIADFDPQSVSRSH